MAHSDGFVVKRVHDYLGDSEVLFSPHHFFSVVSTKSS